MMMVNPNDICDNNTVFEATKTSSGNGGCGSCGGDDDPGMLPKEDDDFTTHIIGGEEEQEQQQERQNISEMSNSSTIMTGTIAGVQTIDNEEEEEEGRIEEDYDDDYSSSSSDTSSTSSSIHTSHLRITRRHIDNKKKKKKNNKMRETRSVRFSDTVTIREEVTIHTEQSKAELVLSTVLTAFERTITKLSSNDIKKMNDSNLYLTSSTPPISPTSPSSPFFTIRSSGSFIHNAGNGINNGSESTSNMTEHHSNNSNNTAVVTTSTTAPITSTEIITTTTTTTSNCTEVPIRSVDSPIELRLPESLANNNRYFELDETSPTIVNLFQQYGDRILLFSSEVIQLRTYRPVKFNRKILVIAEKNLYILSCKNYKLKRRIALESIQQITVSELMDNFLFLHIKDYSDLALRSDRKFEVIQILTSLLNTTTDHKLTFVTSNCFSINRDVKRRMSTIPVGFQYADLSNHPGKVVNNAVVEDQKEKILVKVHGIFHDYCKLDSIVLEVCTTAAATTPTGTTITTPTSSTPQQQQQQQQQVIYITSACETIRISPQATEYNMLLQFRLTERIEGAFIEEKIGTAAGSQFFITQLGDLNPLDQPAGIFNVKIDQRRIKHSRLSSTKVIVRLIDGTRRIMFEVVFYYSSQLKRKGGRVATLSKIFSKF